MRKRWLAILIAAVLAATSTSFVTVKAQTSISSPKSGGTMLVGDFNEPDSLDPAAGLGGNDYEVLYSIFDRLLDFNPKTGAIEPGLATSWDFQGQDKLTFVLHLRTGVTFQDGTPLNASAVVASLDHYKALGIQQDLTPITSIDATSSTAVQLQLTQPYSALPAVLADRAGMIVSPSALKKYGSQFGRHPVGAGPYSFVSWQAGSQIVLHRYGHYWQGQPKLSGFTYKIFPGSTQTVSALISGEIDYAYGIDPSNLASLQGAHNLVVRTEPSLTYDDLTISDTATPTNNILVRQAMNLSINRKRINQVALAGSGFPEYLPVPKGNWAFTPGLNFPAYNPKKAHQLLAKAGYGNGVSISVCYASTGSNEQMFTLLQSQMKPAGINLVPIVSTGTECNEDLLIKKSVPAYMKGWSGRPDPYLTYDENFAKGSLYNAGGAPYPGMDEVLNKLAETYGQSAQKPLYRQLNQLFLQDVPTLVTVHVPDITAYSSSVGGEIPTFQGKNDLASLYFKQSKNG